MSTFAPNKEAGGGFFFSLGYSLHYWSNLSQNHSLILDGSEVIASLYYISPKKLIVSRENAVSLYKFDNETLNLVNYLVCDKQKRNRLISSNYSIQTTASKLNPTSIDYSKPNMLYYADGPSVYLVDIMLDLNSTTKLPILNKSLGIVTALGVSQDLLFTIQKIGSTQTFSRYDLTSLNSTGSIWSIEYPDTILKAVHLGNGVLLCRSEKSKLVLLDTHTGYFSTVNKGTTHLPCDSSECGQNPIEVNDLTSYNIPGQGLVYLYGVDGSLKPVTLHYNSKYTT